MSFCCSRARGHAACLRSQPVLSDHYHLLPVTVCSAGMETYVWACVWPSREHSLHVVCGGGVSCLSRATRSLCFVVGVSWTELGSAGESCSTKWTCSTSPWGQIWQCISAYPPACFMQHETQWHEGGLWKILPMQCHKLCRSDWQPSVVYPSI